MKILHINGSDIGGTGKIVAEIADKSPADETVFLFPMAHLQDYGKIKAIPVCKKYEQGIYRRIGDRIGYSYGFAPRSTAKIISILKKEKPDVVHLHSINGAFVNFYRLLDYLKKSKIPTVVTNHAEFFYTGNCPYAHDCEKWRTGCGNCGHIRSERWMAKVDRTAQAWKKMRKALSGFEKLQFVSVSPWVYQRAISAPLLKGIPQKMIVNGIRTEIFRPVESEDLRKRLGISPKTKIVMNVTSQFSDRENHIKGGRFFIELARRLQERKDLLFLAVGTPFLPDEKNLPANLRIIGNIADQEELVQYYSLADICVVVSQRETFGMTLAEALCCGTPVVGFPAGGTESVAIPEFTEFVPFGDVDALKKLLTDKWVEYKNRETSARIASLAKVKYASARMAEEYRAVYRELTEKPLKVVQMNVLGATLSTGRTTREMHEWFEKHGIESRIVCPAPLDCDDAFFWSARKRMKIDTALTMLTGLEGHHSVFATKKLLRYFDKEKPDVVHLRVLHSNCIHLGMLFGYLTKHQIATVITLHDFWYLTGKCCFYTNLGCERWIDGCRDCPMPKNPRRPYLAERSRKMWRDKRRGLSKIEKLAFVGVSDWVVKEALKTDLCRQKITQRIYNWIDLETFRPRDGSLGRKELDLEDRFVVLGVSAVWKTGDRKGLDSYLQLAEILPKEYAIVLVGTPDASVKLPENVIAVSAVKEKRAMAEYYGTADVYLNLSTEETFGKVSAEALASGVPIVAVDATVNKELVPADCGIVVSDSRPETLLRALEEVRKNGKAYYSVACRNFAEQNFDMETNIRQYVDLYGKLVNGKAE